MRFKTGVQGYKLERVPYQSISVAYSHVDSLYTYAQVSSPPLPFNPSWFPLPLLPSLVSPSHPEGCHGSNCTCSYPSATLMTAKCHYSSNCSSFLHPHPPLPTLPLSSSLLPPALPLCRTYLSHSLSWPPNAVTVRIAPRTSSATAPAFAYAFNSLFVNDVNIWKIKTGFPAELRNQIPWIFHDFSRNIFVFQGSWDISTE